MTTAQTTMNALVDLEQQVIKLKAEKAELLEALHDLEISANTVIGCYTRNPGKFAFALNALGKSAEAVRDLLIAKAGATA